MPTAAARQVLGPDVLIGRSAHDPVEAQGACAAGADYVFLGPIWETASHPGHPGLGVEAIRAAHPATVIAIGGVTPDRVDACLDRGAYGVAAIAALWYAADPHAAAANMLISLGQTPVTPGGVSSTESPSGHSGMAPTITVTVNGQARTLQPQISLLEMLEELELDPRTVVVELNLEIVRRPALGETALQDGDRVELVHFVGGG
jgi:thiamine biosynthesis protein ThiS